MLKRILYRCAPQVGNGNAVPLQPGQHLFTALGILQTGQLDGLLLGGFLDRRAAVQRTVHQFPVGCNTAGADPHIVLPLTLHPLGHRESAQAALDLHFGHNVLPVVLNEQLPLRRIMLGQVARPAAVGDRLSARRAEILDKSLAGRQLLLVLRQTECLAGGIKACRIPAVQTVQHGAAPLLERQLPPEVLAQRVPLKRRVEGVLDVGRVVQCGFQPLRQLLACQVKHLHRRVIQRVRK